MHKPGELVRKYEKGYGEISLAIQSLLDFIREQAKQNAKKRRVANKTIRDLKVERDAALSTIAKVREILAHDEIEGWEHDESVYWHEAERKLSEIEAALWSVPSTGEGNE